jgi:hypothetical protein
VPVIQFELIQLIAKTKEGQNTILTARMVEWDAPLHWWS